MQTHHDTIASDLFDALDRSSQSIYYVIQDGHFVWGNNQGCRVTGLRSREDVFGRPGLTFVHPDDRPLLAEMTRKVMQGEETVPFEWRLYTVDGNTVWVLGALTRIKFNGRPAVLGNYIDITHFKQARRELKSAYKKIEDLTIDLDAIRREERAQVAWELQENLGVTLKILKSELEGIFDRHLPGDRNRELLIRRIDTAQDTIARGFRHLSPSRNQEEDLAAAIQWYAGELADSTGISMRLDGPGIAIRMEPKQTAALFHIFQEASPYPGG